MTPWYRARRTVAPVDDHCEPGRGATNTYVRTFIRKPQANYPAMFLRCPAWEGNPGKLRVGWGGSSREKVASGRAELRTEGQSGSNRVTVRGKAAGSREVHWKVNWTFDHAVSTFWR